MAESDDPQRAPGLTVCTVSDGLDGVMRVAAFLARQDWQAVRTDLQFAGALEALQAPGDYDLILLAPQPGRGEPRLLQAVLEAGAARAPRQILLLPEGRSLPVAAMPGLGVLHGPPFAPVDPARLPGAPDPGPTPAADPARPAGLRGRLGLGRRGRPEGDSGGADPAPPGPLSVLAFQGTCGGAGATTLAVTLAAELARLGLETCLLDLDPQFGGVATYLDLRAPSQVADAYRNLTRLDTDAFRSCLVEAAPGLKVFPAPDEVLPLDAIDEESVSRLIGCARAVARVVVIDMPHALADWSDRAYVEADRVYCVSLPDVRSAQNARKLMALLSGARLPPGRMVHCLNRLPQRRLPPELQRNIASFEQGLGRPFAERFVDGGVEVAAACDLGTPLAELAAANPLRRQVAALADRLAADHRTAAEARGAGLLAPQGSRA